MTTSEMHESEPAQTVAPEDTGHVYDGIVEHDNRLPLWWLVTLWGAIAFAIAYWGVYEEFHVLPGPHEAFVAELADIQKQADDKAAKAPPPDDSVLLARTQDAAAVERGHAVYLANCLPCHGDKGQGVVGPNLTDESWLHGDRPGDIHKTVSEGVVAKGMPAWKPVLGAEKVNDVVTYVLTLKHTHAAGKPAEGVAATAP